MPQSTEQDETKYTKILRNGIRIRATLSGDKIDDSSADGVRTAYDAFCNGLHIKGNGNCVGHCWGKDYIWHSYNKIYRILCDWGSGLVTRGLKPGAFVGIYSKNCIEWMICQYGCYRYSMVVVPLYATLGPEVCSYCINHTELTIVVCDGDEKVNVLLNQASGTPSLKTIVSVSELSEETVKKAEEKGIELLSFEDVLAIGAKNQQKPMTPRPEDLAIVMYTSGTTGNPKGVMLSHRNLISVSNSAKAFMGKEKFTTDDIFISFLPLAHAFQQDMEVTAFSVGASVGYTSGNITKLKEDFQLIKPTVSPIVPRLLNKIYDNTMAAIGKSPLKQKLMKMALASKKNELDRSIVRRNSIWDVLIFSKIQKAFGNNLRILVCGSAPLSEEILTFSRCAFGCYVVEGYGQTENGGATTITHLGDASIGHVGAPLNCAYMKLADVAEMNYYAENDEGEICIKGPHVMMGYYKDAKKTAETIDAEGWLHTGDIGTWLPNGGLKIIDRKKHIFKLAQGEYIAPEKIENIYIRSTFVAQVFVHGESLKACLVAIVVPEKEVVESWAKSRNIKQTYEALCKNTSLKNEILQEISKLGKTAGLHSFEQVKGIYLESEPFSIANNMLTAVLKNKRNVMAKTYQQQIQELYSTLS